jgi:WD40 repeat protein
LYETVRERSVNSLISARFTNDGKSVVTSTADRTAKIWNARTGWCEQVLTFDKLSTYYNSLSADGRVFVALGGSGVDDGTVQICSVETSKELCVLKGHTGAVFSASFASIPHGLHISSTPC